MNVSPGNVQAHNASTAQPTPSPYFSLVSPLPSSTLLGLLPTPEITPGSVQPSSWKKPHMSPQTLTPSHIWHPHSKATHHVTSDPSNLAVSQDFIGTGQIPFGNGEGLNIDHIGFKCFSFSTSPHKSLHLSSILHIRHVAKNLHKIMLFILNFTLILVV